MPELPEVETVRIALARELVGHTITGLEIRVTKLFHGEEHQLLGQTIHEVVRRAKMLVWKLDRGYAVIHLKMTGQLIFVPNNPKQKPIIGGHPDKLYSPELPHKFSHIIVTFDNGTLYFNDLRKFGWLKVVADEEGLKNEVGHLGPEYDWPEFSFQFFKDKLAQRPKQKIKQILLDQTFVAGIGNIYADESLFCAGIRPTRLASSLGEKEMKNLYDCIPKIFRLSLAHGGTSSRDYRHVDGSQGTYLSVANVYHRTGLPCKKCGTPIEVTKVGGRSSHYCPQCQT